MGTRYICVCPLFWHHNRKSENYHKNLSFFIWKISNAFLNCSFCRLYHCANIISSLWIYDVNIAFQICNFWITDVQQYAFIFCKRLMKTVLWVSIKSKIVNNTIIWSIYVPTHLELLRPIRMLEFCNLCFKNVIPLLLIVGFIILTQDKTWFNTTAKNILTILFVCKKVSNGCCWIIGFHRRTQGSYSKWKWHTFVNDVSRFECDSK